MKGRRQWIKGKDKRTEPNKTESPNKVQRTSERGEDNAAHVEGGSATPVLQKEEPEKSAEEVG